MKIEKEYKDNSAENAEKIKQGNYKFSQAFAFMEYRNESSSIREMIWNSRDGAIPNQITARNKRDTLIHFDPKSDELLPDFKPGIGTRIFIGPVDTPELKVVEPDTMLFIHEFNNIEEGQ